MHLKTTTYIRCLIDMSLYKNFNEETKADVMWKKITVMFENKNAINRVSVFRKIMKLRYQDGSSMALAWQNTRMLSKDRQTKPPLWKYLLSMRY